MLKALNRSLRRVVANLASKRLGLPEQVLANLRAANHLGQPADVKYPSELLPMGANILTQGFLTFSIVQAERDWVWPFWIERQYDPASPSFIPRSLIVVSLNVTHRNWTAVGPAFRKGNAIIDPAGLVTPFYRAYGLDTWVEVNGRRYYPSKLEGVEQTVSGDFPAVSTSFTAGPLTVQLETYGTATEQRDLGLHEVTVRNTSEETVQATIYLAIRPYDPEGIVPLFRVAFEYPGYFEVDDQLGPVFDRYPDRIVCSNYAGGDVAHQLGDGERRVFSTECPAGLAHGVAGFRLELAPGQSDTLRAALPLAAEEPALDQVYRIRGAMPTRAQALAAWQEATATSTSLHFSSPQWQKWLDAHRNALLMRLSEQKITPGPYTYDHFWFRDAAFTLTALDRLGYHSQVRSVLESFPSRQDYDGYFRSQNGEWDANGQAIWTVMQHYQLTQDIEILEQLFECLSKGADWIERKRETEAEPDTPHAGLLPAGFSAEHLGHLDYYYWDDFWALAGLREAMRAARVLGKGEEERRFGKMAKALNDAIEVSLTLTDERLGGRYIPASVYRRLDCGAIGSICAGYPLELREPDDERLSNTVRHLREHLFRDGMFYQEMVHSGLNAYLTLHVAQCLLRQGDPEALVLLRRVMAAATSTHTLPEAIHPRTGGGVMGDGHHAWADAEVLHLIRNLVLVEREDRLEFFPLDIPEWFSDNAELRGVDLPTLFGRVSLRVEARKTVLRYQLSTNWHRVPEGLTLFLPAGCATAKVDGVPVAVGQVRGRTALYLSPACEHIEVRRK